MTPNKSAVKLDSKSITAYRNALGMNQSRFWNLFGATQSGGSRYEAGREIPDSTAMLLILHSLNILGDDDLKMAIGIVKQSPQLVTTNAVATDFQG